jgi:hypothetical protein
MLDARVDPSNGGCVMLRLGSSRLWLAARLVGRINVRCRHVNTPFALDTTRSLVNPDFRSQAENPSFRLCAPALTSMDSSRRETGDGRLTFGRSPK